MPSLFWLLLFWPGFFYSFFFCLVFFFTKIWCEQWQQNHRKWLLITWNIFVFLLHTLKQKRGVPPGKVLESEDMEDKDKSLVNCKTVWQGILCGYWSTAVSEQDCADTGLCICALPSNCSKPQLPDLASPHKPVPREGCDDKKRDCQKESEKCPSSQSVVSVCILLEAIPTPRSQIGGGLRDYILVHPLLLLLIFPTYSMSQWKFETEIWLGACCPPPPQVHQHPPHLVTT